MIEFIEKVESWVVGIGGGGMGRNLLLFNRFKFQFCKVKQVLGIGCTSM